jgi:transcriptional regulator with XRE-family HTH domain
MRTVGDRLDELMQAHPLYKGQRGQSSLARKTGVSQPTISRILKGSGTPEMSNVTKLAIEFGVTSEWLLSEREPKYQAHAKPAAEEAQSESQVPNSKGTRRAGGVVEAISAAAAEAHSAGVPVARLREVQAILETLRDVQKAALAAVQKIDNLKVAAQSPSDRKVIDAINSAIPGADKGNSEHERPRGRTKSQ